MFVLTRIFLFSFHSKPAAGADPCALCTEKILIRDDLAKVNAPGIGLKAWICRITLDRFGPIEYKRVESRFFARKLYLPLAVERAGD